MDFTAIGKVGSYIKQKNLVFAANYKIKTGQRITDSNGQLSFTYSTMFEQVKKSSKKTADQIKAARLASIKNKLMAGRKLSNEEMGYLRVNDSGLYKKAKHAEDAREELKAELKGAKSKQEARQILTRVMVKASAEAAAEISACKGGASIGAGSFGAGGEINISAGNVATGAENISTGEVISTENLNVTENISNGANVTSTENISGNENSMSTENNFGNENSDGKTAADNILEKFIMTIRALEDEWRNYTNSDEYKDLPENFGEDKPVYKISEVSSKKVFDAIFTYRNCKADVDAWKNITLRQ